MITGNWPVVQTTYIDSSRPRNVARYALKQQPGIFAETVRLIRGVEQWLR